MELNYRLLNATKALLKQGYVPPPQYQQPDPTQMQGMPPGMDPSQMGGMPPGGAPGMPPGMDPSQMGGMPPGMDPQQMMAMMQQQGGMPPGGDPNAQGGQPPQDPSAGGGAPAEDPNAEAGPDPVEEIKDLLHQILKAVTRKDGSSKAGADLADDRLTMLDHRVKNLGDKLEMVYQEVEKGAAVNPTQLQLAISRLLKEQ